MKQACLSSFTRLWWKQPTRAATNQEEAFFGPAKEQATLSVLCCSNQQGSAVWIPRCGACKHQAQQWVGTKKPMLMDGQPGQEWWGKGAWGFVDLCKWLCHFVQETSNTIHPQQFARQQAAFYTPMILWPQEHARYGLLLTEDGGHQSSSESCCCYFPEDEQTLWQSGGTASSWALVCTVFMVLGPHCSLWVVLCFPTLYIVFCM